MVANGEVRACCQRGDALVVIESRPEVTVRQCVAVQADGTPCGRRHFTARLVGLGAEATAGRVGE